MNKTSKPKSNTLDNIIITLLLVGAAVASILDVLKG